ncbi:sulfotransferase family 2 domain-containing protein [Hanstruepera flava]|uniref:sulfotransferase family 2 domain-containing protein n=1 Tax=Hanstruepera flava TaxID=2930218 RepID=UPI002028B1FA|nr:sulfotransferase family 2 domain-containing protein [Hanstruepera flava]
MGAFLINNPKCVFVHIPKVAGTSIRNGVFKGDYEGPVFKSIPNDWNQYFKFAFVRNPYDRMVSAWKMFTEGMEKSKWSYNNEPPLKNTSFIDFIKIATDASIDYHSRNSIKSVLRHHTLPQIHPYHCFIDLDFIGKFENLESDFSIIAKEIGLRKYKLNHLNKTKRIHYREYYDNETFELVSNNYKEDIERFGYSF